MINFDRLKSLFFYPVGIIIVKLSHFMPYKQKILSTWHNRKERSKLDKLLLPSIFNAWINIEYLREKDPDKREKLKEMAMGGDSGAQWAKDYDIEPIDFNARIGDLPFLEAIPSFALAKKMLEKLEDIVFIQIGSSSGREIAYFAQKFPRNQYIGTDIYQSVIEYSSNSHRLKNLQFILNSAKDIEEILKNYPSKPFLIFSSGSLQYVQPEHLSQFFSAISKYNLKILLNEPSSDKEANPSEIRGSIWRENFSYVHNYKYYAERAGMTTKIVKLIKPYISEKWSTHQRHLIHYFYYGESKSDEMN